MITPGQRENQPITQVIYKYGHIFDNTLLISTETWFFHHLNCEFILVHANPTVSPINRGPATPPPTRSNTNDRKIKPVPPCFV